MRAVRPVVTRKGVLTDTFPPADLPEALLALIFSQLTGVADLAMCTFVCKAWAAAFGGCRPRTLVWVRGCESWVLDKNTGILGEVRDLTWILEASTILRFMRKLHTFRLGVDPGQVGLLTALGGAEAKHPDTCLC